MNPKDTSSQLKSENKQLDSLKKDLEILNDKINKYEIGSGYFNEIIKTNTQIFATIITTAIFLFGLASYFGYKYEIEKLRKEIKTEIDNLSKLNKRDLINTTLSLKKEFDFQKDSIDKKFDKLNLDIRWMKYDISRSLFFIADQNKYYGSAFYWSIRSMMDSFEIKGINLEMESIFIIADDCLDKAIALNDERDKQVLIEAKEICINFLNKLISEPNIPQDCTDMIKKWPKLIIDKLNGYLK